jgi:hypothetical protein
VRYLLIAALLAVSMAVVGVTLVANPPTAQGQVRINIGVPVPIPYFYSPTPCEDCWYGEWEGRQGYHRGGGRPWEREHWSDGYRGGDHRSGEREWHEGHR